MKVLLFGGLAGQVEPLRDLFQFVGQAEHVTLLGYAASQRADHLGADLSAAPGQSVSATCVEVAETSPLAAVMGVLGAAPRAVDMSDEHGTAYGWVDRPAAQPWDGQAWRPIWAAIYVEVMHDLVALLDEHAPDHLTHALSQIVSRAATKVRAAAQDEAQLLRQGFDRDAVTITQRKRPYLDYFMMDEIWLAFRRFDGTSSPVVKRAGFVTGDAVTVLPYDPVRDCVLLIEQFRYAPYLRGDRYPWSLEAVAGRIDAGETPEDAARREALEETGLSLTSLHGIGNYYPSPGAVVEYLFSYVGLADLPDAAARIAGVESEAEDIRGQILTMDQLEAARASGELANGPLLLSVLWLQLNRARLRAEVGLSG